MKSFLMIGQSNMAGRGDFGEVEPILNSKCFMLRCGRWQTMHEPVNPDRRIFPDENDGWKLHSGISLAASFADEYAKHFDEDIGLIPCADGGTKLAQWMPGEVLFDHAVMQARLAMRSSELVGILWHQGESDSEDEELAGSYFDRLSIMMTELRRQLGVGDIPIVAGELGEYLINFRQGKMKHFVLVNEGLHRASAEMTAFGVASSKGLECRRDVLHFTSASCREFGKRYFAEYLKLVK